MGYYIGGLEFEKKKIFLWCVEEILNNPVQQYKYFHICIKSINIYVTVRTVAVYQKFQFAHKAHLDMLQ